MSASQQILDDGVQAISHRLLDWCKQEKRNLAILVDSPFEALSAAGVAPSHIASILEDASV